MATRTGITTPSKQNGNFSPSPLKASPISASSGRKVASKSPLSRPEKSSVSNVISNPLKLEFDRQENMLRAKDKEADALAGEMKSLKQVQLAKDKAIAVLRTDLDKLQEKHGMTEKLLDEKILELKKANNQKKASFASQAAAEATMRRLQASIKTDDSPALGMILAPLEAQIKSLQKEVAKLGEDTKAQERNLKAKEAALMKAEEKVEAAEKKAKQVDVLVNKTVEMGKLLESKEEEIKVVERMHRQKVEEVRVAGEQVVMLQEALTAAGAAASTIKDYQRQVMEMQSEQRDLQEELARAKVGANRVATVVANEWKDDENKMISMKHWLEERKYMQGEFAGLKEKLAHAERSLKSEAQMKAKLQLRVKTIHESLSTSSSPRDRRLSSSISKPSTFTTPPSSTSSPLILPELVERNGGGARTDEFMGRGVGGDGEQNTGGRVEDGMGGGSGEDVVPGPVHDVLQREVIALRKTSAEKDQGLKDRDDAIEMLSKKVELLTRAMETEARKTRREVSVLEKQLAAVKVEGMEGRIRMSRSGGGGVGGGVLGGVGVGGGARVLSPTPRKPVGGKI